MQSLFTLLRIRAKEQNFTFNQNFCVLGIKGIPCFGSLMHTRRIKVLSALVKLFIISTSTNRKQDRAEKKPQKEHGIEMWLCALCACCLLEITVASGTKLEARSLKTGLEREMAK